MLYRFYAVTKSEDGGKDIKMVKLTEARRNFGWLKLLDAERSDETGLKAYESEHFL